MLYNFLSFCCAEWDRRMQQKEHTHPHTHTPTLIRFSFQPQWCLALSGTVRGHFLSQHLSLCCSFILLVWIRTAVDDKGAKFREFHIKIFLIHQKSNVLSYRKDCELLTYFDMYPFALKTEVNKNSWAKFSRHTSNFRLNKFLFFFLHGVAEWNLFLLQI